MRLKTSQQEVLDFEECPVWATTLVSFNFLLTKVQMINSDVKFFYFEAEGRTFIDTQLPK